MGFDTRLFSEGWGAWVGWRRVPGCLDTCVWRGGLVRVGVFYCRTDWHGRDMLLYV
jgi:hypothetical protein